MRLVTSVLAKEFPEDQSAYATNDLERLTETYQGPANVFFIAEEGNQIIGTCGVKADGEKTAILRRLFVDPHYRGRGIGFKLLQESLGFCRRQGFEEVVIRTSNRMEQAVRLCRLLGFSENGSWTFGDVTLSLYRLRLQSK